MNIKQELESLLTDRIAMPVMLQRTKREDIDFSTNIALVNKLNPIDLIPQFKEALADRVATVSTSNGFINIRLTDKYLLQSIKL